MNKEIEPTVLEELDDEILQRGLELHQKIANMQTEPKKVIRNRRRRIRTRTLALAASLLLLVIASSLIISQISGEPALFPFEIVAHGDSDVWIEPVSKQEIRAEKEKLIKYNPDFEGKNILGFRFQKSWDISHVMTPKYYESRAPLSPKNYLMGITIANGVSNTDNVFVFFAWFDEPTVIELRDDSDNYLIVQIVPTKKTYELTVLGCNGIDPFIDWGYYIEGSFIGQGGITGH